MAVNSMCADQAMIHVVVGIVFNREGDVLIAQRPADKAYAGYWEFPGGKVEMNETSGRALVRELREELGIDLQGCIFTHFMRGVRENIVLDFYTAHPRHLLTPQGLEGQAWKWTAVDSLDQYTFPEPNTEVIAKLRADGLRK